jgi:hypothetical protein
MRALEYWNGNTDLTLIQIMERDIEAGLRAGMLNPMVNDRLTPRTHR